MALTQIVTAGHRAGEIVTSTRAMFRRRRSKTEVNINDLVSAVMPLARIEARKYHIAVQEQLEIASRQQRVMMFSCSS